MQDIPVDADRLLLSDYTVHKIRDAKWVPGAIVTDTYCYCPRCEAPYNGAHGVRKECDCGVSMVAYGNALYVWGSPLAPVPTNEKTVENT